MKSEQSRIVHWLDNRCAFGPRGRTQWPERSEVASWINRYLQDLQWVSNKWRCWHDRWNHKADTVSSAMCIQYSRLLFSQVSLYTLHITQCVCCPIPGMFMCLRSVYFSQRYPLEAIGDMSVISAAQIHNVMMIRLACSSVFADWLKKRKASICKE